MSSPLGQPTLETVCVSPWGKIEQGACHPSVLCETAPNT